MRRPGYLKGKGRFDGGFVNRPRVLQEESMRVLLLVTAIALAGCAGSGGRTADDRQYDRLDFRARFVEYRQLCAEAGGHMYINAVGNLDREGVPPRGSRYRCARQR